MAELAEAKREVTHWKTKYALEHMRAVTSPIKAGRASRAQKQAAAAKSHEQDRNDKAQAVKLARDYKQTHVSHGVGDAVAFVLAGFKDQKRTSMPTRKTVRDWIKSMYPIGRRGRPRER